MEPVRVPIEDVLDLHTFNPKDIPDLLAEYFMACVDAGIFSVRIIHGKGSGILKNRVSAILRKDPRVLSFNDAPREAGGWGATIVALKK
jgi:DNA-nicking Smr family endonuclease